MKRIVNIILLLFVVMGVNAQGRTTTDRMLANEVVLDMTNRNQTVYLEVSLNGDERTYSAYSVDLVLPGGVSIAYYQGEPDIYFDNTFSIYPSSRQLTHALSLGDVSISPVAIGCISTKSLDLTAKSGKLFNVGLVLNDKAQAGLYDVKLNAVYLITGEAVKYKAPDTTARLIITDPTGIEDLNNPDDTSGAIYSVEGVKVDAPQKGHVYIVDGKKMKF